MRSSHPRRGRRDSRKEPEKGTNEMTEAGSAPQGGEKILIVAGSAAGAEDLRQILQKHRYQVSVATSAVMALDMISHEKPALIACDTHIPEMDGYELCRRVKTHDEYCEIRFVLLTSSSDPGDVIRGLECGADTFITKPWEEDDLVSRMGYLLVNRYQPQDCASLPGLKIVFGGKEHVITSGRHQILDLLLSTYETAIRKNNELLQAHDEMDALNKKLQAVNYDLEAFAFTISHDLRGPLNNIFGSCQVIEQLYGGTLSEQCQEFFRYIHDAAGNMDKLIDTILRFSIGKGWT
jgi:DNA-binding response OmpR family regulator